MRPMWQSLPGERAAGFAGSCLIALGAAGVGVLPRPDPLRDAPVLSALRHQPGSAVCLTIAIAGMVLLIVAWLRVGRRVAILQPRWLIVTALLWALPFAVAPPVYSRDVYAYAAAGGLWAHGINPYSHGAGDLTGTPLASWISSTSTSWYDVPFAYGPVFLLLATGVVRVAGTEVALAVLGMRLLAIGGMVLLGWALPRLARACGAEPRGAVWLGLLNPLVLAHFVGGAHADASMAGLLVAGLAVAAAGRPVRGAVVTTLAAAVKATAALAIPFIALLRRTGHAGRPRTVPGTAAAVAITGVVAAAAFAALTMISGLGYGWSRTISTVGLSQQWTSPPTGIGMAIGWSGRLLGFGEHTTASVRVCRAVGFLAALVIIAMMWVRAWRRDRTADTVAATGWALLAVVMLGPAVHPWYLTWPVTVLAGAGILGRSRLVLVVGSVVLCLLVLPDGYNLARSTVPFGVALDVAVLIGLTWYVVRRGWRSAIRSVTEAEEKAPA